MGNTYVSPLLQQRLKNATWWQRRKFNWALSGYISACTARTRLVEHLNCGRAMADHITFGKVSLADDQVDAARDKLAAIIDTLPKTA